jgi:polyisoprenoid-binding protein YceI
MHRLHHHARAARLVTATTGLAALIALATPLAGTAAQDNGGTVLGTPAATTACVTDVGTTQAPAGAETFTIAGEQSVARYRAQEELASIGANEAVGETSAIVGQILLDADGIPLPCSRFDVDLRTLKSDEARRDNFLYDNTLQTGQYPLATFVLTGVEGLDGPLPEGEATDLTLVGNLTVHGETKLVAWDATVTRDGDALTGSAAMTFDMADFGIEEPVVGPVLSVDKTIRLEVEIAAQRAA